MRLQYAACLLTLMESSSVAFGLISKKQARSNMLGSAPNATQNWRPTPLTACRIRTPGRYCDISPTT